MRFAIITVLSLFCAACSINDYELVPPDAECPEAEPIEPLRVCSVDWQSADRIYPIYGAYLVPPYAGPVQFTPDGYPIVLAIRDGECIAIDCIKVE